MRRGTRRIAAGCGALALLAVVSVAVVAWVANDRIRASLPDLDGTFVLDGLSAPVTIERDALGVPTIRGATRLDVARATGWLHAQDRLFQMDLLRRNAAGELAALAGPAALTRDRLRRRHRFRDTARRILARTLPAERALLSAYAEGVEAGRRALGAPPPEYLLLRRDPEPWTEEDSLLVVLTMYLELQGGTGRRESAIGLMHDLLPGALADFLLPPGTSWDAPIDGSTIVPAAIPGRDVIGSLPAVAGGAPRSTDRVADPSGSNNFAVSGAWAAGGAALLAGDMHLPLALPNYWYRASLVFGDETIGVERQVTGVTLPGVPLVVSGSNGHVAWAFTNMEADTSDLVLVEVDPHDPDRYRTPDGSRHIERHVETIDIAGERSERFDVDWTIWGPLLDRDHLGRRRALRWVAHDDEALDLGLARMERASDVTEALDVATTTRIPAQNCVVADAGGRIGWAPMGPLPERFGHDGSRPASWADGTRGWRGLLAPDAYPRLVDPTEGRLWTANNRVVGGAAATSIGDGGFDLGARATQIRDGLRALERATPRDLLAIQLDDRASFLERWRGLLLDTLDDAALVADPRRATLRDAVVSGWTGRASVDSAGYVAVRTFRLALAERVFDPLLAPCRTADAGFDYLRSAQWEGPLWTLVVERPEHLLPPSSAGWDAALLAAADATIEWLGVRTWGERNTVTLRHPLSAAVPELARWLDAPAVALPGDRDMPRVQSPGFGASQRMVVAPGRESDGLFHMPGGQSGHPLSPFYLAGHAAWVHGEPTPFLPGPTLHRIELVPGR